MILVIVGISSCHTTSIHCSFGKISVRIIVVSYYLVPFFIRDRSQFRLPVIGILQRKFSIISHFDCKGRFIPGTIIAVILDYIFIFCQLCRLFCHLSGHIIIDKASIVLCCYIPIGIVGIGMYRLFPRFLFLCHHLRQTVLVIIGVFLGVSIFVNRLREVAVGIIGISLRPALRIGIGY